MATMQDIADKTGFNISTISRALNGNRDISESTRQIILDAKKTLGYENKKMRQFAKKTIGIIVPELHHQPYIDMLQNIQNILHSKGFTTIITISGYSPEEIRISVREMKRLEISGVFVVTSIIKEKQLKEVISMLSGIPTLFLSETNHLLPVDTIFIDQSYIIDIIVQHLKERKCAEIAYFGEHLSNIRLEILIDSCKENGIVLRENMIFNGIKRSEEAGYSHAKRYLKRNDRPDTIVASYDQIAIGAMRAFHEAGVLVPEDVAIMGIDDEQVAKYLPTRLTSVKTPVNQMCSIAVKLLLNQIAFPREHVVQHVSLLSKLIVRESSRRSV